MKIDLTELNNWYDERHAEASLGLEKLGFKLCMEVKIYPERNLNKQSEELLSAAGESTIRTFGWPIAVFLDAEEYRPKRQQYGINAEISINDSEDRTDRRYDYWAINENGSFYLLKSLFEDARKPNCLFFDTRIIRTAEVLMYAINLYSKLGLDKNEKITVKIKYSGLTGLIMAAAGNRLLMGEYKYNSNKKGEFKIPEITATIKDFDEKMSDYVKDLVKPLFQTFSWFEIGKNIIDEIVSNYRQGKIR